MENNNIPIKDNGTIEYKKSFAPIKLKINFKSKETSINYYFHKCNQIEFQEVPNIPNSCNLETIYFIRENLNPEEAHSTTQPNSNRIEVDSVPQDQSQDTLYFIK